MVAFKEGTYPAECHVPGFEIFEELGSGTRGTVYRASDGKRIVALKVFRRGITLSDEALRRLLRGSSDRLRHPNVPPIESAGRMEDGRAYWVLPLLRGDSVHRVVQDLKRGSSDRPAIGPLFIGPGGETPPGFFRRAAELFAEAAEGLAAAHACGISHRRISPRNLILSPTGRLAITDFGGGQTAETGESLAYRAPEELEAYPDAGSDPRISDVYSLGAVLYEVVTRRAAFQAESPRELRDLITRGKLDAPRTVRPEIPEKLEACILKAMAAEPGARYPDAGALAADLRRFLRHEEPLACARPAPPKPRMPWALPVPRQPGAALAVAVLLCVIVALAARGLLRDAKPRGARDHAISIVTLDPGNTTPPPIAAHETFKVEAVTLRPSAPSRIEAVTPDTGRATLDALRIVDASGGTLDGWSLADLHAALERTAEEESVRLLCCSWDASARLVLDEAPRPALARLEPNLFVELDEAAPRGWTRMWIGLAVEHQPSELILEAPRLARREDLIADVVAGLESIGSPEACGMLVRLACERPFEAGRLAIDALSNVGAHGELVEIARRSGPLGLRLAALHEVAERYAGAEREGLRSLAATSPEPSIRALAFECVARWNDPDAASSMPAFVDDLELRDKALLWLDSLPRALSSPVFVDLLRHPSFDVRARAVAALARASELDLTRPLARLLLSRDRSTRNAAADALLARGEWVGLREVLASSLLGNPLRAD